MPLCKDLTLRMPLCEYFPFCYDFSLWMKVEKKLADFVDPRYPWLWGLKATAADGMTSLGLSTLGIKASFEDVSVTRANSFTSEAVVVKSSISTPEIKGKVLLLVLQKKWICLLSENYSELVSDPGFRSEIAEIRTQNHSTKSICLFANIVDAKCLFENIVFFLVTINMPLWKYQKMLFAKWLISILGDYS